MKTSYLGQDIPKLGLTHASAHPWPDQPVSRH